ncbi:hypothetical protein F4813DRAFT_149218 [Daldinia decipiens]|uniref:uncharacterized protein n=1 Tax=Daldinia decipiens TaxID=326647 RepID=UPI0020C27E9E|nr:uncharacterized protein F4813DRAFT_149218 [Daldinia decipiens]KAI1655931.1 hypothetical protein F4813DRAFT_149218 [Daldinia decipiens]
MYVFAALTFASAALAVPFPLRRAYGTGVPSYPAVPIPVPTFPGTAPTGGSTALPTVVDPTTSSSYHVTVTYATSSSVLTSAVPFPTSSLETYVSSLSSPLPISQPEPTPSVSQPADASSSSPTFPASFPTFPGTASGTTPGTVPTGSFPQQPATSQYSVSVSYSRTNPGYPVATPN